AHEGAARSHSQSESRFARFQRRYASLEQTFMRGRWILVGTYVLLAGATIFLLGSSLGTEIFPRVDAGQIQLRFRAPTGTQINATEGVALQAVELIKEEVGAQNVEITLGFIGVHGASYPINLIYLWNGGPEEGVLQVQLKRGSSVRIEPLKER